MPVICDQKPPLGPFTVAYLLLAAVLFGLTPLSCDRDKVKDSPARASAGAAQTALDPGSGDFKNDSAGVPSGARGEAPATEQSVFYADMLDAYDRGEFEQARALAKKYLIPANDDVLAGKAFGCGIGLRVMAGMLYNERQIPAESRFGNDEEFVRWLEQFLLACRDLIRANSTELGQEDAASMRKFLKGAAVEWILARQDQVSHDKLAKWYAEFSIELNSPGWGTHPFSSVDALLASAQPLRRVQTTLGTRKRESNADPNTGLASEAPSTEQSVFYTDMLDTYDRGDLHTARALAQRHLRPAFQLLHDGTREFDLMTGLGGTLVVLNAMLLLENELALSDRLGGDPELADWLQFVVLRSLEHARKMRGSSDEQAFINRTSRDVAREWLLARQGTASRAELEELYQRLRNELVPQGFPDLESVLRYSPMARQPRPVQTTREVSASELGSLSKTVADYFHGLIEQDQARIAAATGLDPEKAADLVRLYHEDCREEGIREVRSVVLPTLTRENLRLRSNPKDAGRFSLSVSGIRLETVRLDGSIEWRTVTKLLEVRQHDSGRWIIVP